MKIILKSIIAFVCFCFFLKKGYAQSPFMAYEFSELPKELYKFNDEPRSVKLFNQNMDVIKALGLKYIKQVRTDSVEVYSTGQSEIPKVVIYNFDTDGGIAKIISYDKNENFMWQRAYHYENGRLAETLFSDGDPVDIISIYTYDSEGRLARVYTKTSGEEPISEKTFTYEKNTALMHLQYLLGNRKESRVIMSYDDKNYLNLYGTYTGEADSLMQSYLYINTYDDNGRLTQSNYIDSKNPSLKEGYNFEYDGTGRITERIAHTVSGNGVNLKYEYDEQGRLVKKLMGVKDYPVTIKYEYDERGSIIKEIEIDEIGNVISTVNSTVEYYE